MDPSERSVLRDGLALYSSLWNLGPHYQAMYTPSPEEQAPR